MKKIFIGSSTASKKKANVLKGILENLGASVTCWYDIESFALGDVTIDILLAKTREYHAGVFVLGNDDKIIDASETERYIARDNVMQRREFLLEREEKIPLVYTKISRRMHLISTCGQRNTTSLLVAEVKFYYWMSRKNLFLMRVLYSLCRQ